jgi:hypothetical protein
MDEILNFRAVPGKTILPMKRDKILKQINMKR